MKYMSVGYLYHQLVNKKEQFPLEGQIDLTYRCRLKCVHCYCRELGDWGQRPENKELTTKEVKRILDEIHREGCIWITFSGGDPLVRDDFLEIYSYARQKGFVVSIFTSGLAFTKEIIDFLVKSPPQSLEITLNGATKETYEAITCVKGSFLKVMKIIKLLAKTKLNLRLKTNCLKQNKQEVAKIKAFTDEVLGKPKNMHRFGYSTMIHPRLNGDRSVCDFQPSFQELLEIRRQDKDMWGEYREEIRCDYPKLWRKKEYLYMCNAWMNNFFIDPYGRLKFCLLFEKFSVDLKTASFREGFYKVFPKVFGEKFKTDSKCRDCSLRPICDWCPARAYLETGDEEAPVPQYCQTAEIISKEIQIAQNKIDKP